MKAQGHFIIDNRSSIKIKPVIFWGVQYNDISRMNSNLASAIEPILDDNINCIDIDIDAKSIFVDGREEDEGDSKNCTLNIAIGPIIVPNGISNQLPEPTQAMWDDIDDLTNKLGCTPTCQGWCVGLLAINEECTYMIYNL